MDKVLFSHNSDEWETPDDLFKEIDNLYHFTIAMYYRIFIEKLFPQYKKAIYLDCDIVVLSLNLYIFYMFFQKIK